VDDWNPVCPDAFSLDPSNHKLRATRLRDARRPVTRAIGPEMKIAAISRLVHAGASYLPTLRLSPTLQPTNPCPTDSSDSDPESRTFSKSSRQIRAYPSQGDAVLVGTANGGRFSEIAIEAGCQVLPSDTDDDISSDDEDGLNTDGLATSRSSHFDQSVRSCRCRSCLTLWTTHRLGQTRNHRWTHQQRLGKPEPGADHTRTSRARFGVAMLLSATETKRGADSFDLKSLAAGALSRSKEE